jgi:hypothetical protein
MDDTRDPNQSSSHNFGFLTKVKYGGALGKITAVAASFFITLCFLTAASWHNPYLLGGIALMATGSLVFLVLQMKSIFLAYPKMATLEGTEVLRYVEIELKSRNQDVFKAIEIEDIPPELILDQPNALSVASDSVPSGSTSVVPPGTVSR